jgi:glycine/D-amino acid oxidase-like deaminating enzyme
VSSANGPAPIVIIGAGAIGLCTAFYLRQAGRDVVVIDRAAVGAGSSWGNAGWVCLSHAAPVPGPGVIANALRSIGRPNSPLYLRPELSPQFARWMWHFWRSCSPRRFSASYRALAEFVAPAFDLFDELSSAGIDTTLTRPGLMHAYLSTAEAERTLAVQREFASIGYSVPTAPVTGNTVRELEPSLSGRVAAGYVIDKEGVLNPGIFTAEVAKRLTEQGVQIIEHSPVIGFRELHGRVTSVRLAETEVRCSAVVVAAGTWSADVLSHLGIVLPLQAGKGYSFSVNVANPPTRPIYFGDKHIVASPIGGQTRFAGTMEFSGNNRHLEWRRIVSIAEASKSYLGDWFDKPDDLVGQITEPWVGGRPMLPDGLPVLDALPDLSNVFLSTGHGMLGITLAPASGKSLASYVVTGCRPTELSPFRLARLAHFSRPQRVQG